MTSLPSQRCSRGLVKFTRALDSCLVVCSLTRALPSTVVVLSDHGLVGQAENVENKYLKPTMRGNLRGNTSQDPLRRNGFTRFWLGTFVTKSFPKDDSCACLITRVFFLVRRFITIVNCDKGAVSRVRTLKQTFTGILFF